MSGHFWLALALAAPIVQSVAVLALSRPPGLRDVMHIAGALTQAVAAFGLLGAASGDKAVRLVLAQPLPNVDLAFAIEPIGALAAAAVSLFGALHAVHTAGFVRATGEREPARLMSALALTSAAALGAMLSANLFTFFVCAQALALATFPLVAHGGGVEARRAAAIHLSTLLAALVGLFMPAMAWVYANSGGGDFRVGGILQGWAGPVAANVLLVLFVLGLAMTATPPLHRWILASSRAPFPALVSMQALALTPVGGVGVLKVTFYVFGDALAQAALSAFALLALVAVAMCYASIISVSRPDVRERLAYAAMTQSLAVVMGALLAWPTGTFAALMQIIALACGAGTMIMALGAAYAVTERCAAEELRGLGRIMPWSMAGFAVGAASMIGMPPFAGAWAKLWLIAAANHAGPMSDALAQAAPFLGVISGLPWAAAALAISAVFTFVALGPLAANALVAPAPVDPFRRPEGASILLTAPIVCAAGATLWLLVVADRIALFVAPLLGGAHAG